MRYIVATDGSDVSDLAVEHAASDASVWSVPLEIVHVLAPEAELIEGEIVLSGGDRAIEQGRQILENGRKNAGAVVDEHDADIEIRTELLSGNPPEVLSGNPPEAITDHARETGASRIHVGHRGLSKERERVVGSVAKTVVDNATVPVSIVR